MTVSGVRPLPDGDTDSQTRLFAVPYALTEIDSAVDDDIWSCALTAVDAPAVAAREIEAGENCIGV